MAYNSIKLRPLVSDRVLNHIAASKCIHVDAWLYLTGTNGQYALIIEERLGGRDPATVRVFTHNLGEQPRELTNFSPDAVHSHTPLTINGRKVAAMGAFVRNHLNSIHWNDVVPYLNELRATHKRYSFVLHYVRAPSLDPTDGILNMYELSGRGDADDRRAATQRAKQFMSELVRCQFMLDNGREPTQAEHFGEITSTALRQLKARKGRK